VKSDSPRNVNAAGFAFLGACGHCNIARRFRAKADKIIREHIHHELVRVYQTWQVGTAAPAFTSPEGIARDSTFPHFGAWNPGEANDFIRLECSTCGRQVDFQAVRLRRANPWNKRDPWCTTTERCGQTCWQSLSCQCDCPCKGDMHGAAYDNSPAPYPRDRPFHVR
jgi:hypothetical protein